MKPTKIQIIERQVGIRVDVVTQIFSSILNGNIQENDRLVAQKLATQMGVSATPIREALAQLAEMGIVNLIPNRGAICRKFGADQIREVFEIRGILEAEAVRKFASRYDYEKLSRVRVKIQLIQANPPDNDDWLAEAKKLDTGFHLMIARGCGNDRLSHEITRTWSLLNLIHNMVHVDQIHRDRTISEHLEIIEALLQNDGEKAAHMMRQHIDSASKYTVDSLFT